MEMTAKKPLAAKFVWEFAFYSFIGWAYETILTSILWGRFAERGFLHIPFCPIYGFCSLLLILILYKIRNVPLLFFIGGGIITAIELAASYVLELITGTRLWDYSEWILNYEGRISLISSLIFGALCVILIKLLHPMMLRLTSKIKTSTLIISAVIITAVFIGDLILKICI